MLDAFVRDVRLPVDEEAVYDGTSTNGPGYHCRTLDGSKIFDDSSHLASVGRGAMATCNVFHDNIANTVELESEIDLGNSHVDVRASVDDACNVGLGAGLTQGHAGTVFNPSKRHVLRLAHDGHAGALMAICLAKFHDSGRLGQVGGHVIGENERLDDGLDNTMVGHDEQKSTAQMSLYTDSDRMRHGTQRVETSTDR